jgi:dihydroorotase
MREILERATRLDLPVLTHCEDMNLSGGVMHRGTVSDALDLPGIPAAAEDEAVARDIALAEEADARLHVMHVSTTGTVELIRKARKRGAKITAEATPHHFSLTDGDVRSMNPHFKMNPPLRGGVDREALRDGLADGTIDCIASDHAPHTEEEKAQGFLDAPFGCIGLETVLPLTLELVETGTISLTGALASLTSNPARILGVDRGTLRPGEAADITVFDPSEEWTVDVSRFESSGRNCPFDGRKVKGRVKHVLVAGVPKYPFPR